MASVTVDLGAPSSQGTANISYSTTPYPSIGTIFAATTGQELFLGLLTVQNYTTTCLLRLAPNTTQNPNVAGHELLDSFEQNGTITVTASDGTALTTIGIQEGIGNPSEPYSWSPWSTAVAQVFVSHVRGLADQSVTLTLDDNLAAAPSFADDTGDAQSWTQNTAIVPVTVPAATGTPTPTYAAVGTLPAGIAFNTTTRVISGTRTATGSGTITIRASNSEGSDDWTVAYTTAVPPATVPSAPTGFAATVTHNSVSLTWDDPGDASIISYQILRRDITGSGSLGVHIDSVPAGTSYVDTTNVEPENTYSYRIKARNAQGLSAQSGFQNVTTLAVPSVDHAVDAAAVAWTFGLPEPTVSHTTGHAVDAGPASWTFALPEPTVTHTPRVTVAHAVDAGAVAWVFNLPEPTVTHAPRVTASHAVDAGDASWVFGLPEPTVTHTARVTADHAVNAGAVSWTFALPQPAVTHVPASVPSAPTGLAVTATHAAVSLTWDDPGDASIISYQILRRDITGGGSLGVHIDSAPAGTSYVDTTNVASSNTYSYRIKARNAQGLSAQSGYRNATTSAAPLTPINHAVDAAAVAWTFDLPEPTVTHTARVPVGHAVDAEAVAWVFNLPEPTVTSAVAFSVELTLTQTATENVYTWTNPDSYILDFVCADDNPIGPLSGYSSVRSSIPASLLTLSYTRPAGAPYYALRLVSTDQFSNTVGPADNVASGDYAVDAVAVSWVYGLPEPTVTHAPRVTASHAVDAGDASWTFALPQPTVTHTPRVTTDHAVDAGAVAWAFDLPEPTVSHTTGHAVDAGDASWTFDLPQPTVTYTPNPDTAPSFADDTGVTQSWTINIAFTDVPVPVASGTPTPTYAPVGSLPAGVSFSTSPRAISGTPTATGSGTITIRASNSEGSDDWTVAYTTAVAPTTIGVVTLEIDWDNDGTFSHAAADVTVDLVRHSLRTTRGRTLQSRRKATAGRLEAKLWNRAAKYDPVNSSSPIYEKDLTGVRVRVKMDGVTVWSGILDAPRYRRRPVPQLDIIALGRLSTLRQPVSVATQTMLTIGEIAKLVGGAIGITTTYLTGGKSLDRWKGVDDQDALSVLHDLEETEEGFLLERQDGELALQQELARSAGASAVSALTLTDQIEAATDIPLLEGSALDWGFRYVANAVYVPVTELSETGEITMITGAPNPVIPAGGTRELLFSYPAPSDIASRPTHQGAASWTEPVAGTDYTAQNGLTVTGTVEGEQYRVRFENSSGQAITVDDLEIRGEAIESGIPVIVSAKDAASIARFGEREYARPSPLFTTIGAAQEYADGIISRRKLPHGWLVARWPAYLDAAKARTLDLSRRITVERLGETADYFIEGIGLAMRGFVRMEYLLSPVPGVTAPSAPVVTVAVVSGQAAHLAVSWTAPFNGGSTITGYDVRYKKSTDSSWTSWTHTGTGRTTTITGLEQGGVSYDVQVRAKNAQGSSLWSVSGTGLTESRAPSVPSAPTVMGGVSSLAVSWTAPYNGGQAITGYGVQYKKSTDTVWIASPHTGTGRTTTITGVHSSDSYDFQVQATNSIGTSGWSDSGSGSSTVAHRLYAATGDNKLYTINTSTGAASLVGSTVARSLAGLDGVLYTESVGKYYTINPSTGARTLLGGSTTPSSMRGLAGLDGVLYALATNDNLYTINTSTGARTYAGNLQLSHSILWNSLAGLDGVLYATSDSLYTVNTSTGTASRVGSTTIVQYMGSAQNLAGLEGVLYAIIQNNLYTINTSTGVGSLVGSTGIHPRGLAGVTL